MTKKEYKHSANMGYMRYYRIARQFKYVENRCKQSLKFSGYLEGIRNLAVEDMSIHYEDFDEVLAYCRMLEERFDEKLDL